MDKQKIHRPFNKPSTDAPYRAAAKCWYLQAIILTGALALRSNVLLRLEKDAVILGSSDFADYPVGQVRCEGKWIQGHVGLIYPFDANNTGIVGPGKIAVDDIDVSGTMAGFLRLNILGSGIQDPVPVPGLEGISTIKNFSFSSIRVKDVPVLVDGTGIHPDKPLDGFSLINVSGTFAKGISLANINHAKLSNINVTGYAGPLLQTHNVTGSGLDGAVAIAAQKLPETVVTPVKAYQLH